MILTFPGDYRMSSRDQTRDLGDPVEEWLLAFLPESVIDRSGPQPIFLPTRALFDAMPFLSRNLVVREANLVSNWPTQTQIDQFGEDQAWQNFGVPISLRGRDLRYGDFERSIFVRVDLRNADLEGANLSFANLQNADLDDANLGLANLERARLQRADLQGANLQFANLTATDLSGANLYLTNLQAANLAAAVVKEANLKGANLRGASLFVTNLRGTSLTGLDLRGASLANTDLQGADLSEANLQGASFASGELQGANLSGANLQGTDFEPFALGRGSNLHGAVLKEANLEGANLRGVNLEGSDLRGAHFWRALVDEDTERWNLADLRGVDVHAIEDVEHLIAQSVRQVEPVRRGVAENLRAALVADDRPETPRFPDAWRSAPNVMLDPAGPLPQALGWGARVWATDDAYDEELAEFLGELACGDNATTYVARGLAERVWSDSNRLYAKQLAARLTGDNCPPAAELPDDMRANLEQLAAGAPPAESAEQSSDE